MSSFPTVDQIQLAAMQQAVADIVLITRASQLAQMTWAEHMACKDAHDRLMARFTAPKPAKPTTPAEDEEPPPIPSEQEQQRITAERAAANEAETRARTASAAAEHRETINGAPVIPAPPEFQAAIDRALAKQPAP